ncbi:hypothetical protein TNCT_215111 [Trichonephila clavata]|uniref:Uncharacterized protein n=1 Tax=Trichonephila clavata TaxID=2740835 RepID=A0A8X6EWB4_TRICU|nr:hypothetical protein TNCT_215111 [Trichonephila clavata]
MIEIEKISPSNTPETTEQLEEEAAKLDEKIKLLEGLLATTNPEDIKADLIRKGIKIEKVAEVANKKPPTHLHDRDHP